MLIFLVGGFLWLCVCVGWFVCLYLYVIYELVLKFVLFYGDEMLIEGYFLIFDR